MAQHQSGPFAALFTALKSGDISRRDFIQRDIGFRAVLREPPCRLRGKAEQG